MMRKVSFMVGGLFALWFGCTASAEACESKYSYELNTLKVQDAHYWASVEEGVVNIQAASLQQKRIERIVAIEKDKGLCTFSDYLAAASIYEHGLTMADKLAAIRLSSVAQSLDPTSVQARQIFARSVDELTFRAQGKQIYGTLKDHTNGKVAPVPELDGVVSDQDRKIAQQLMPDG